MMCDTCENYMPPVFKDVGEFNDDGTLNTQRDNALHVH